MLQPGQHPIRCLQAIGPVVDPGQLHPDLSGGGEPLQSPFQNLRCLRVSTFPGQGLSPFQGEGGIFGPSVREKGVLTGGLIQPPQVPKGSGQEKPEVRVLTPGEDLLEAPGSLLRTPRPGQGDGIFPADRCVFRMIRQVLGEQGKGILQAFVRQEWIHGVPEDLGGPAGGLGRGRRKGPSLLPELLRGGKGRGLGGKAGAGLHQPHAQHVPPGEDDENQEEGQPPENQGGQSETEEVSSGSPLSVTSRGHPFLPGPIRRR